MQPRLTLVAAGRGGPLHQAVATLERTFCDGHPAIIACLAEVEARTPSEDRAAARAIHEQAAFIRVGLSGICDAIGELASQVTALDSEART